LERGADDDGTLAGLPWASVFDTASNLRALGEIQRRGVRAAGEVVDRLVRSVDGDPTSTEAPGSFDGETNDAGRADFNSLTDTWTSLLRGLAESFGELLQTPGADGEPALHFGQEASAGVVRLEVSGAGPVRAEIWLHNRTEVAIAGVVLRGSDLLSGDGALISAGAIGFEPPGAVPMPARSSRGIDVVVDLPPDSIPGTYRGTLLVQDHPDVWLPVVLIVEARSG
jgi:hypothetical protein